MWGEGGYKADRKKVGNFFVPNYKFGMDAPGRYGKVSLKTPYFFVGLNTPCLI